MASLTFDALWRDRGVVNGLKALATQAEKTRTGFDRLGAATGVFKRLGASSAQASRAGMSIGTNLQRGILRPMAGLPGIIAGLVGGAVVMGAKRLATEASDMNETVSKTRTIFGTSSKAIESWAKGAARNLGMSRLEALNGASAFGNLFDQLGFGVKQATAMSKGFVQMATDAASFSNANPAEVMDAFQAATRGEFDALQKYIPTVSAATIQAEALRMTHKKSASDLTAADKAAALYQVSVKGLGKAHGDFARTSGGFANQQRIMAANWADLRVKIGTYFLPVFTRAAKYMNEEGFPALTRIVDVLGTVGGAAARMGRAVTKSLSGTFGPAIDAATINLTELADWFETHQAGMIRFFVGVGDAAFAVGRGIARFVSGTIRSFGTLTGGLADMLDQMAPFAVRVLDTVIAIENALGHDTKALRDARDNMGPMLGETSKGLRDARTRANETADAFDRKVFPALERAQGAMHRVGAEEIWKAKQRDAAARASQAIRDIGTKADGSQIKLKSWNERTRLGAVEQQRLEGRLKAARQRMDEQRAAGIRAGESQRTLTTRWNQGRAALEREFRQMGLSKEAAHQLAIRYSKIPKKAETKVSQPGMPQARRDTWDLDKRINNLNNKKVSIRFETNAYEIARKYHVSLSGQGTGGGVARGGILPGFTPVARGDDLVMGMRRGEGVYVSEAMRNPYERHRLKAVNKAALSGKPLGPFQGLAGGGLVQRNIGLDVGSMGAVPSFSQLGDKVGRAVANRVGPAVRGALAAALSAGGGAGGPIAGGGFANALRWARGQQGKPYIWTGVGPGGYDCSGFMSALVNVIRGKSPYHRLFSTGMAGGQHLAGMTRGKMSPFRIGVWKNNPGHTAGTLNGVNVESSGGVGVRVGGRARGANNGLFNLHYGLARGGRAGDAPYDTTHPHGQRYDPETERLWKMFLGERGLHRGGVVRRPGVRMLSERGPERVLSARQTNAFERMVGAMDRGRGGGNTYNVTVNLPGGFVGSNQDLVNTMVQMGKRGQMDVVLRSAGVRV